MTPEISSQKLDAFISEVGREVGLRTNFYPKLVSKGEMKPEEAAQRRSVMSELYEFLKSVKKQFGQSKN